MERVSCKSHAPAQLHNLVPYDQWFITHLDDNQKVKQVKHWILSKCNIIQTPHLSAQRPVSPITFASSIRTRTSVDSVDDGYNEDDEYDEDSDDLDDFSYRHPELRRQAIYSRRPGKTSTVSASRTVQPGSSPVTDQYTLISFSTGTILEDDFALSWYKLRPCELLEMHRSGKVVQLPREIMSEYVQPYFESKARALRAVWSVKSGRFESPAATGNRLNARGRDKISTIQTPLQPEKKRRKAKVEWKDRWIVINHGTLSLCKDSSVRPLNIQLPHCVLTSKLPGRNTFASFSTDIITRASWRGVSCKGLFHHCKTTRCLSQVSKQGVHSILRLWLFTVYVFPLISDCRRLENRRTN